jgi:hypothetical protein
MAMPLTAKGSHLKEKLQEEYGPEKGERVLYAGKNAGTFSGIDSMSRSDAIRAIRDAVEDIGRRFDAYCDACRK